MKTISNRILLIAALLAGGACSAFGQNVAFTNGDLILGFQATSGTGSDKNVFFILGSGVSYRDNGAQGMKGNVGATLSAVFGANWYTRQDLWFGVIGNLNQNPTPPEIGSRAPVAGDPSRTVYVSSAAAAPGGGFVIPASTYGTSSLGTAGASVTSMEKIFGGDPNDGGVVGGFIAESDGSGILDSSNPNHSVAWNNSWSHYNPTDMAAFDTFTAIQQNFGKGGSATYVDVQRVLSTNTGAVPTGVAGGGTYETTISIGSDGTITSLLGSAATPYDTWALSYPALDTAAKRLSTADPDEDGTTNLAEFGFGGNPSSGSSNGIRQTLTTDANSDAQGDLTLTLEVRSGASFTTSGNDMIATQDGVNYRVEGSTDLVTFDSLVSEITPHMGAGSPSAGYVFKTFRLVGSNGLSGKGFLRASVSE